MYACVFHRPLNRMQAFNGLWEFLKLFLLPPSLFPSPSLSFSHLRSKPNRMQAFNGLWEFLKLSAASGVMLCLENWYYRILILMTGYLSNATIVVDALSVCMSINGWELMIRLAFLAATRVRVANELGVGSGKGAAFATKVSIVQSTIIGVLFCVLVLFSIPVLRSLNKLRSFLTY